MYILFAEGLPRLTVSSYPQIHLYKRSFVANSMAPDITSVFTNGHSDGADHTAASSNNAQSGSEYRIPDITYYSPQNRKLKVLPIGAGVSGILMAYQIQKNCENVEHVIDANIES